MVLRDRVWVALLIFASPFAAAGDEALRAIAMSAPLAIPHSVQLDLDLRAKRRGRSSGAVESAELPATPGLRPLTWPRNTDVRARLMTPELRRAPLVGWIAKNLYRDRMENGWSLEVDPGEGEYVVFYRVNL
jgi:hypothetical protein